MLNQQLVSSLWFQKVISGRFRIADHIPSMETGQPSALMCVRSGQCSRIWCRPEFVTSQELICSVVKSFMSAICTQNILPSSFLQPSNNCSEKAALKGYTHVKQAELIKWGEYTQMIGQHISAFADLTNLQERWLFYACYALKGKPVADCICLLHKFYSCILCIHTIILFFPLVCPER